MHLFLHQLHGIRIHTGVGEAGAEGDSQRAVAVHGFFAATLVRKPAPEKEKTKDEAGDKATEKAEVAAEEEASA